MHKIRERHTNHYTKRRSNDDISTEDSSRPVLRPLGAPTSIRVRTDRAGTPVEIRSGSRTGARTVVSVQETWKIDDEWWRAPISRLYHRVVLENGKLLTLYRDLMDGQWYAQ